VHDRKITPFEDERKRWQIPGLQPLSVSFKISRLIYKPVLSTKATPCNQAQVSRFGKKDKGEKSQGFL